VSTSVSIADPTSLRRELDERMKKLEREGNDCSWLDNKKICILSLFEHRKPASTAAPQLETVAKQEAIEKCRAFFRPGSLEFEFQKDACDDKNKAEEEPTNLQAPTGMLWKARASSRSIGN
jgi:hypothetical protein